MMSFYTQYSLCLALSLSPLLWEPRLCCEEAHPPQVVSLGSQPRLSTTA